MARNSLLRCILSKVFYSIYWYTSYQVDGDKDEIELTSDNKDLPAVLGGTVRIKLSRVSALLFHLWESLMTSIHLLLGQGSN